MPVVITALLSACAGGQPSGPLPAPPEPVCKADALPAFIGRKADAETGAAMLAASGARSLRWVAPGMAVTMDYRADRLTVGYDREMVIQTANCG